MKVIWGVMLAGLMLIAAPQPPAEAMSLIGSGSSLGAPSAASDGLTIEVRHGGHGGHGRHGGRFFRHGGGRFFGPAYYVGGPRCHWVETVYGPRRICRRGPWW